MTEERADAGGWDFSALEVTGRIPLTNRGEGLLELTLEPLGEDYWMRPGETFIVTSYGDYGPGHPFEVQYWPDSVSVWCTSWFGTVSDDEGNQLSHGHQRPDGAYPRYGLSDNS
ncbi:hypothetical protein [Kitasatospora purpeofusca]|uniref:hypothetical protein n=1 Tax=Kitasatospora purpeofusca TaxID=67352 RepID=UPI003F4AE525